MRPFHNPCFEDGDFVSSDTSEGLDINVELRLEDALSAAFQIFSNRARIGIISYSVATIGSILLVVSPGEIDFIKVIAVVFSIFLLPVITATFVYRNAKLGFERVDSDVHIMQYHLSPDGVLIETLERPGWFEWDAFESFLELRAHFVLFVDNYQYYVIPKRDLSTSEEIDRLRAILGQHVGIAIKV